MKKYYELEIELITLNVEDCITTSSGFAGEVDSEGFGTPSFDD